METRKKLSESNRGKKRSEESRRKMSNAQKGEKSHMFGKPRSDEIKKKISNSRKGKMVSKETRRKMSEAHKGEKNHLFGKSRSEETKKKISENIKGERHPAFKGYYMTPWGKFPSASQAMRNCPSHASHVSIRKWCKKNNQEISGQAVIMSPYLQEKMIGKTFKEIGFSFEKASFT